jgi:predicted ATP-grasp superfamily ATP-dependent carboligase
MADSLSVLIPDGDNDFALAVVRCLARAAGVRTSILSADAWARSRFSRHRARYFTHAYEVDDTARLGALAEVVRRIEPDVVLPVGQRAIRLLADHPRALDGTTAVAPVPEPAAFAITTDKWLFADFLARHGIRHPATIDFDVADASDERLRKLPFPALIKPRHGSYGRGILLLASPEDVREHFCKHPPKEGFILQTFVDGYDIDCSVLCREGEILAHTIQKSILPGYHPFAAAAGIEFVDDAPTLAIVRKLVSALRWSGIAHVDLRYDSLDGDVRVIEMNPRFWGTLLGSLVAGVNFPYLACLAALGRPLPESRSHAAQFIAGKAAIRLLARQAVTGRRAGFGIGSTTIGFALRDPLPELLGPVFDYASRRGGR